jgi:hypothetical protein
LHYGGTENTGRKKTFDRVYRKITDLPENRTAWTQLFLAFWNKMVGFGPL